jgi:hypothetical protein
MGNCQSRGLYLILWKRKQKSSIETGVFVHHEIELSFKRVEIVSDRVSYTVLGGSPCKLFIRRFVHQLRRKVVDQKTVFECN